MTTGCNSLTAGRMKEQIVSFTDVRLVQVIFDRLISLNSSQSSKFVFNKFGSSTSNNVKLGMYGLD